MSLHHAYLGSLVADALAMPGHWYYDRAALRRDYQLLDHYQKPRNPHPDSILWRSSYAPLNDKGDILHDQARYWGQRDIHYHQFLAAGENTLNLRLAAELHSFLLDNPYNPAAWLQHYAHCMLTPGWHRDTYLEECHRGFFTRYAQDKPLLKCGIRDEHIGGLAQVPALLASLADDPLWRQRTKEHVHLTHQHPNVLRAADCLARLLHAISGGTSLLEAIQREAGDWISSRKATRWHQRPDEEIIGSKFSSACYIDQAFPAALYLALKYHDDFSAGIIANAMVGGDNCHRGVVVGALLGAANGINPKWLDDLLVLQSSPTP